MKKELEYSELEYNPDMPVPEPLKNAGLYTGDVLFDKKPWGNTYLKPKIDPDATIYASQFYAKHHIPSYNRPGNNTVSTDLYDLFKLDNDKEYNLQCYKHEL
jgi:hypothetical protein